MSSPTNLPGTQRSATSSDVDGRAVLEFILNMQRSLDLNQVANVAVNDGRLLWGVDRVSLVLRRRRRTTTVAVSGQESVHPRGNLVRTMSCLAKKVIESGDPLKYDGALESLPPQLEAPLAEFVQESGCRYLLIVPLFQPRRLVPPEEPLNASKTPRHEPKPIGALVIEQMSSSQPSPQLHLTIDLVIEHISAAIWNSESHGRIFLLPLWRSVGLFLEWFRGWRLAIAGLILVLVALSGGALAVIPWEYRVDGTGRLMPVIQREVFAPLDAQVVELRIESGQHVAAGDVLLQLRSDELAAELVTVENKILEKRKLLLSLNAQREVADKQANQDESVKLQGKIVEATVEMNGAVVQWNVLKERHERLTIRAPITGVVTTFQVEQLLLNRPVKRGDVLMQVMDDNGDWQLELEIAEHRVGRILQARQRKSQSGPGNDTGLLVKYCLLTQPESNYDAVLSNLATRAVTAETQGTVLEGTASLDKSRLPSRAIGAEVRARIGCGTSSLGDVLFGDVVEFALKYLWW